MQKLKDGSGRVRCCGRIAITYKRKGYNYCPACSYTYELGTGRNLGVFGSGLTLDQYREQSKAASNAYYAVAAARKAATA